jgi:prolyl-tRNA synthetase
MTHGDDQGLILPPKVAPIQIVIVPIFKTDDEKSQVMDVVQRIAHELSGFRLKVDDRTEVTPGFKFNDWEMRGVPLRVEIGPKDVQKGTVALARRDILGKEGKSFVSQSQLASQIDEMLKQIQSSLYNRALSFRNGNTHDPKNYEEFRNVMNNGWALTWWCGSEDCEARVKEDTKATTRCIPIDQQEGEGRCIVCDLPAQQQVYFARAY